jgi:predicted transcriptional regulator
MSGWQSKKRKAQDLQRIVSVWEQNEFDLFMQQIRLYRNTGMSIPTIAKTLNTTEAVITKVLQNG